MLNFSLENIIHSNAVNFVLMLVFLAWALKKAKVDDSIEEGRKKTENHINNSVETKKKSEEELKNAQLAVDNLDSEVEKIFDSAKTTLKSLEAKIVEDTEKQVQNIEGTIEKIVSSEVGKVNLKLTKGVSNASVALAQQNIEKMLDSNKELHEKFIYESIEDLDKVEL